MLNFTINLRFRDGRQQWGVIYDNGTFTKGFGDLHDRKTDILFGNLYIKGFRLKHFDMSSSYLNQPVILVLSLEPKLNVFKKLLCPFQSAVWILVAITVCFGIFVILAINYRFKSLKNTFYGTRVNHPIINLILAIIGQPQTILPRKNFARFILMMTLILFLVIRSIYQGYLYKFLQSDGRHMEPQTVEELIDKKYIFILYESNLDLINNFQSKIQYRIRPSSGSTVMNLDSFIGTTEQIAYFSSRVELIFYSSTHDNFPFKICKEQFATSNVVLYFNKNFVLKRTIDEAIYKILVHGFVKFWLREFDKTSKWKHKDVNPIVMTFEHLSGAFHLLLIGNVVGLIVFLIEISIIRIKLYFKGF
ncbi:glutamate receptor ionotropic, NMDA 1-like [Chironomus tepperi]|uniref:glutamate receptor ionotropic, NMDA 1-like n=1 Tax=Chironomus tepperi TaxID=113505 RepID=UPI00391F3559